MKRIALTILSFLIFSVSGAIDEKAAALFNEANDLFHRAAQVADEDSNKAIALYQKAAMRYERLVTEYGIRNGQLYYNIGNTYVRMGKLGRAILNYRRAKLYIPNDVNLDQNLNYARSRCLDKFEQNDASTVIQRVFLFWHYDLSVGVRTTVFVLAFILVWVLAAVRLYKPQTMPRAVILCIAVVSILFGGSLAYEGYSNAHTKAGVITANEVVARKGDGETYEPSFKDPLHPGVEFELIEKRGEWCQVRLPDNRTCWIPSSTAELVMQ